MENAASPEDRDRLVADDLRDAWPALSRDERAEGFRMLPRAAADDFFLGLSARDECEILTELPQDERRSLIRLLPPDDAADVVQEAPPGAREGLLAQLDDKTRKEVSALLAYAEDAAGGLMSPRFARVRPDMTCDEAITYLRRQARQHEQLETIYYVYVLDEQQHLLGVASFRELFASRPDKRVRDAMQTDMVTAREDQDQESVSRLFAEHDLVAVPVVDAEHRMKGIVTVDDIVDVVQEEATEDMQKLGGMQALDAPYLEEGFFRMVKKRAGWLSALFVGELLTASAMSRYEDAIASAVVLALFIPLIISSGGNSGSQASTLVIRAMALGEVRLRDIMRVTRRELGVGLILGLVLGLLGFARVVLWQAVRPVYGEHYLLVALAVSGSLMGVVLFGTLAGSLLPFLFRRIGLDPASASAPFVATLVDVTGIVIYFSIATLLMSGALI